jgi:hypothetical protein
VAQGVAELIKRCGKQNKAQQDAGLYFVDTFRLVHGVDDEVTANQDHRDADKQRNKKDWHVRLLSVVVLVEH